MENIMNIGKAAVLLCFLFAIVNTAYAESEECEAAKSDAESYAYDLESKAKKLRRCASNEGASDLEYRAKKLQSCASYADYTDDCYSEFRKVKREYSNTEVCYREYKKTKNAFSDYESSVSDVSSYCE
jgi:hypothetical protein